MYSGSNVVKKLFTIVPCVQRAIEIQCYPDATYNYTAHIQKSDSLKKC